MRAVASGNSVQVLLKADLLRGVGHLQLGQPAQVGARPGALAGVGDAVAQQQGLEPVARIAALAHRVLAGTHQIAHGLVGGVGHAHGAEFAGARQAGQQDRITPVGLHAIARALGDRRRGDDLAGQALRAQVAPDDEAAGAGLVDDVQRRTAADELAQRLVQRHEVAADAADVPHFAVAAGLGHGDVDAVLVYVQADVHAAGDRFTHGPSPRKFATTWPPIGPVHWCSSAGLARATYGVAGGGPPLLTKPSCLAGSPSTHGRHRATHLV
jgi:hypothetical protein